MRRLLAIYGSALAGLLLIALSIVQLTQMSGVSGAIRMLGKSEKDFQEARTILLLSTLDPVAPLIKVARDRKKSERVRIQALTILQAIGHQLALDSCSYKLMPMLDEQSANLRKNVLQTLTVFGVCSGGERLKRIIREGRDTSLVHLSLEAFAAGSSILNIKGERAMAEGNTQLLDSCLTLLDSLPTGKGEFFIKVSQYFRRQGDNEKAASFYKRACFFRKWWLLGTFPNPGMKNWIHPLAPETTTFDPKQTFMADDTTKIGWTPSFRVTENGKIFFEQLFVTSANVVIYLSAYILVPTERDALLFTGSDDGIKIFINDSLVYTSPEMYRADWGDMDMNRIHLRAGANRILLKIGQELGYWLSNTRLMDFNGEPMKDVIISLTPEPPKNPADPLLTECEKGMDRCRLKVDSTAISDDAIINDLLTVAGDNEAAAQRRSAALKALVLINEKSVVPAAREILRIAEKAYETGARDAFLDTLVYSACLMKTAHGFDFGSLMRKDTAAHMRFLGNMLLASYSANRLNTMGILSESDRSKSDKIIGEIEMLDPIYGQVAERLASYHVSKGDTAHARRLRNRFAMPEKWLAQINVFGDFKTKVFTDSFNTGIDFDSVWKNATGKSVDLRAFQTSSDPRYAPLAAGIPEKLVSGKSQSWIVFCTQVTSERDDSVMLDIMVPSFFISAEINGQKCQQVILQEMPAMEQAGMITKLEQVSEFRIPMRLRAGENLVKLCFFNGWMDAGKNHMFRCGFTKLDGNPIPCKENRIELKANTL